MRLLVIWTWLFAVACSTEKPLAGRCDDDTLCENVAWCVSGGGCESPTDCTYSPDGANCMYGAELGRCQAGRCEEIPAACDGASVDPGEACDGVPVSCAALDGYHAGTAACRNCVLDEGGCYRVGWTRRTALPAATVGRSLWADSGVVWIGTIDGLFAITNGTLDRIEDGAWPYVAGLRNGDALALRSTGELVRFPRAPGEAPIRTQVTSTPRSLTVIGTEIFIGAPGAVHRASTGFAPESVPGGDVFAVREVDGVLYAAGGSAGAGRLWRYTSGSWSPIELGALPTITALTNTGATLELLTSAGWYRLANNVAEPDPTRPGTRAVAWSEGRFAFDSVLGEATAYIDANGRVAPIEPPSSTALTAATWDADRRTLWVLDRGGEIYSHAGVDLTRLATPGVADLQRVGNDLAAGFDGLDGEAPYLTLMRGDGLTVAMPPVPPTIATATAGTTGAILGTLSVDRDHHFVSRMFNASSAIFVYDTSAGSALPKSWGGPANIRAFAHRAGQVLGVGLGGAVRYTGLAGVQTWAPTVSGLLEGIDLRAVAATSDGFVAVGVGGAMYAVSPASWTWERIDTGTTADLAAVHVIGDEIFAAGTGGTVLRCVARTCATLPTGVTVDLDDLDGLRSDDLFVVGGGVVLHRDGTRWNVIEVPGFSPSRVAVSESTVWLGGREATSRGLYQLLRISPL